MTIHRFSAGAHGDTSTSPWFPDGIPCEIVLASASPRRSDLLRQIGLVFTRRPAPDDDVWPDGTAPDAAVERLAIEKARSVAHERCDEIVIGADTAVVIDGKGLGKPRDADDAMAMLRKLVGREHVVMTGYALLDTHTGASVSGVERTNVAMRCASDDELRRYVESGEPFGKAGAYGIQGLGAGLVTSVSGCYNNVVGLPVTRVVEALRELLGVRRSKG